MKCHYCNREVPSYLLKQYKAHAPALKCPHCGKNPHSTAKQVTSGVVNSGGFWNLTGKLVTEIIKGLL